MFFENDRLAIELSDVLEFHFNDSHNVGGRPFHALSYRVHGDTVLSANGKELHAADGTLTYIPAHCAYRRASRNDHCLVVHFEIYNQSFSELEMITPEDGAQIEGLFRQMLALSLQEGTRLHQTELLYRILRLCCQKRPQAVQDSLLRDTAQYIDRHFRQPSLTVASLAQRLYLSEVTFRKHFTRCFGTPPKEYLLQRRFSYALTLLDSQELSVSEIAALAGFADEKHFSTLFRSRYGVSPSQYKRNSTLPKKGDF